MVYNYVSDVDVASSNLILVGFYSEGWFFFDQGIILVVDLLFDAIKLIVAVNVNWNVEKYFQVLLG